MAAWYGWAPPDEPRSPPPSQRSARRPPTLPQPLPSPAPWRRTAPPRSRCRRWGAGSRCCDGLRIAPASRGPCARWGDREGRSRPGAALPHLLVTCRSLDRAIARSATRGTRPAAPAPRRAPPHVGLDAYQHMAARVAPRRSGHLRAGESAALGHGVTGAKSTHPSTGRVQSMGASRNCRPRRTLHRRVGVTRHRPLARQPLAQLHPRPPHVIGRPDAARSPAVGRVLRADAPRDRGPLAPRAPHRPRSRAASGAVTLAAALRRCACGHIVQPSSAALPRTNASPAS